MSLLPAGYKRLEYIQSSAEGTYINLNITPSSNNLKIIADVQTTVAVSTQNVFLQINKTATSTTGAMLQLGTFSSKWQVHVPNVTVDGTTTATTARWKIKFGVIGTAWSFGGVTAGTGTNTYFNTGTWRNNAVTVGRGSYRHYGYEIYFAGKLQRLLVPAKNASNAIGMYDVITGTFYANVGSGSYTAGPEIADADIAFKQVEYIESSGTQYVDTGFKPNQNTRVVADFVHIGGVNEVLFGGRKSSSADGICFFKRSAGYYATQYNDTVTSTSVANDTKRHTVDCNKNVTYMDGVAVATHTAGTFTSPVNLCLFASNDNGAIGYYSNAKIYGCRIYDNGVQIRKYVPHVTALGTPGLLDTVNNVFYSSVTAADFVAGPEVVKEWTLVEWVQTTGVQYVDTGFKPNQNTRVVMDAQMTVNPASGDNPAYFAATDNSKYFRCIKGGTAATLNWEYGTTYNLGWAMGTSGFTQRRVIDANGRSCTIDGSTQSYSAQTFALAYNLYLLASNNAGTAKYFASAKLFSTQIYDNGSLLYDLKPCRLLDGRVGLVDESSSVFFASATTTALIAGPDLIAVPLAPEGLTANVSSGVLTLSWTASENAEGYDVYRNGVYVATTFDTTFTDTINPATAYEYGVTAYNEHGESEMSTVAVPATRVPEQVVDLRAMDAGFNYITLTWDNVAGADAYRVFRDGILLSEQAEVGYSDSGLKTETAYTYGVSAMNEVGESPVVEITVSTTEFELVTDRTAADVQRAFDLSKALPTENIEEWLAGMKGAYNVFDLNRVELAVLYVIERLRIAGWYITVESKTDWKFSDFPTVSEMTRYLNNIRKLRSALPKGLPAVPADMDGFTYNEANDIERLLEMLDAAVTNIMANVFYSNELYSGEVQ